jgi:predicted transposase YdaD
VSKQENPHDRFFKETLGDPELAAEFLTLYLPPELSDVLDTSRLVIGDTSMADLRLETHLADLLFQVGLKTGGEAYIYILPEHKSYPDKWVGLQSLSYETRLFEAAKARKAKRLPVVIPVVVYHGKRPWPAKSSFIDLFGLAPDLAFMRPYLPRFDYHLVDLSRYEDEQIIGSAPLSAAFLLLKYVFRPELDEKFPQAFQQLGQAGLPQARLEARAVLMTNYLLRTSEVDENKLRDELMDAVGEEASDRVMITTADRMEARMKARIVASIIEEEKPYWLQQGQQIGQQAGSANLILLQARQRFARLSKQVEARIRALPVADLEALGVALLNFKTVKDLTAWLQARAN